jgi:hypothetical protein
MASETNAEAALPSETLTQGLHQAEQRLKDEARERSRAAKAMASIAKPTLLQHPKRLAAWLQKAERDLSPATRSRLGLDDLWRQLEDYQRNAPLLLRRALGRALKEACDSAGLEFRVVTREDPVEVRIAPLSVRLDFPAGIATMSFARSSLATCELSAERILKTYDAVLKELEKPFDPRQFFATCRHAYRLALADTGANDGERIELTHLLPFVAMLRQSARFQRDPSRETFRSYGRAHLAYDVLRLRRQGGLVQDGLRLNLGVATGISASQKGRVIYFEDEHGNGEFKLTLYFTHLAGGEKG